MLEHAAYPARCKHAKVAVNFVQRAAFVAARNNADALPVAFDNVQKCGLRHNCNVFKLADGCHKLRSNFLARAIGVKNYAIFGVPALSGGRKAAVTLPCKFDSVGNELVGNCDCRINHTLDRLHVVFPMSRAHSIFKVAFIVGFTLQTANSALREIAVALFGLCFAD